MLKVPKIASLQYLCNISEKNVKDEVDFLPADKHERFLQVLTIILGVCGQTCPNYPKNKFEARKK